MLSESSLVVIKQTIPVLEEQGTTITKVFYNNMLNENKDLLNYFNMANQKRGAQPLALATTILAAAKNIDDLSAILPHVEQIAHKHRALQIKPEHYPIVGQNLLRAIQEVLGKAATPELIHAWAEAYAIIADIFISIERRMYDDAAWPGWMPFKIISKKKVCEDVLEFSVVPRASTGIELSRVPIIAGQYITVKTHPTRHENKYDALRHYSISSATVQNGLKFAVKLENRPGQPIGLVSENLHKDVSVGDDILLSAPAGVFTMDEHLISQNEIPLVLLSAGIGVTPLISMLEVQLLKNPDRPIYWIQSSHNESKQAFRDRVNLLLEKGSKTKKIMICTDSQPRIDRVFLEKQVPAIADVYVCGSLDFMNDIKNHLKDLNHQSNTIHYEPFGPKMATLTV